MPELGRALEEGVWPEHEPPAKALVQDGGIPQPDRVRIRAWAEVAASYLITDPRAIDALSPYYISTTDYAEKRLAWKRGLGARAVSLGAVDVAAPAGDPDLVALDLALERLATLDARQARVVELRFSGGLSIEETAGVLGVSPGTVKRDWESARLWLFAAIRPE